MADKDDLVFSVSCSALSMASTTHTASISIVDPTTPSTLQPVYEMSWSGVKLTISPNKVTVRKVARALTGERPATSSDDAEAEGPDSKLHPKDPTSIS